MRHFFLFLTVGFFAFVKLTTGQTVYTDPAIPTADEAVVVYFNATGTELEGYSGDIYAHTGVTIDGNKWKYVISDWDVNIDKAKLENVDGDLHKLIIEPSIRDFYEVPESEEISELCLVFRSSDQSLQTKPDIFIEVFESGLNVSIINPSTSPYFVDQDDDILIEAEATEADEISIYVDGSLLATATGNSITETITADNAINTKHWIKVVASNTMEEDADSIYYYVRGETGIADLPAEVIDGINYIDDQTVTLVLHAPYKNSIFVGGDFSNWEVEPEYALKRNTQDPNDPETRYWVTITGLNPGEEYAFVYLIDESIVVSDPYADKILDPWNDKWIPEETYPNLKPYPEGVAVGLVSVLQTAQEAYEWQVSDFEPPDKENLIIYECLIRDFLEDHSYKSLADTIGYFKRLGVNAIELMPIMEFGGNISWGYNPHMYFAPDKYYGPKDRLKEFIDVAHQNGIAVIFDIVLNHAYNPCPLVQMYFDPDAGSWGQPTSENPWFNVTSPNPDYFWGQDFDHESQATKDFIDRVNRYWLEEYNIDGFRFDFTKGFTNTPGNGWDYDPPRIAILKRMANEIWEVNPDAYVILEHFAENTEEKELSNHGMLIWGNINYNYNEATMGYHDGGKSNFSSVSYKQRGWSDPHLVGYMESHDEERLMAKNLHYGNSDGSYNIMELTTALERQQLAGVFYFTIPGPKMIWQFGELGYEYYINYPGEIGEDDYRTDPKPITWEYIDSWRRQLLFNVYSELLTLKKEEPVFSTDDFSLNVNGAMKTIHLNHSSMNVAILGNFDVVPDEINPSFQHDGWWYEYFSRDSLQVSNVNGNIQLEPGEFRIYSDVKLDPPDFNLSVESFENNSTSTVLVYPNPAKQLLNIEFYLATPSDVKITIYDLRGQTVCNLYDGVSQTGIQKFTWDLKSNKNLCVPGGMYLCTITRDGVSEVIKLVVD